MNYTDEKVKIQWGKFGFASENDYRHFIGTMHDRCRQRLRPVILPSQTHTLLKGEM
ncbi:hypothetical protein [Bacteroides bouchesdurhonensis]|uniref:hypothetical protein n=1 Tax=Bacteroides bouchesdurhonensis TaxID=1841855 RepID=UPI001651FA9C|nr:hypothetical protein [Bacteroides bouchesdurhonensis]